MRPRREGRNRCRRRYGALVMTFMLSWVLAPAVHAQFEVAAAAPAVEAGHSDQCHRIHTDAICLAGSIFQFQAQSNQVGVAELDRGRPVALPAIDWFSLTPSFRNGITSVRAPPTV